MTKQELRKLYREKRIGLSDSESQMLNEKLVDQVVKLDIGRYSTVHLFLPIAGSREPNTFAIADQLKRDYPHMRLVLSKIDPGTFTMRHMVWDAQTVLSLNTWRIPEPADNGITVQPREIDAVFVPLLAFDTHGNRVGYGKGFYDRFLCECRPDVLKIGLSFFEAEERISDAGRYDVALDCCVTPHRLWYFNKES